MKKSNTPTDAATVSIVIPCYLGERFLRDAVQSCLDQTYPQIEVIIVDDASPDNCFQIAEEYANRDNRVRAVRREVNGGVARAFNSGFALARGAYFSRLAQDDCFRKDAIELMVRHLEAAPGIGLVYCDEQIIDETGEVVGCRRAADEGGALANGDHVGLCVMWRREVWERVGQLDPAYDAAEDYEYWLRLAESFPIAKCHGEAPFFHRVHSEMGSKRFRARQELATARARVRYCQDRGQTRRLLANGHFEAGYAYRFEGDYRRSLWHSLCALWYGPTFIKNYRSLGGLVVRMIKLR